MHNNDKTLIVSDFINRLDELIEVSNDNINKCLDIDDNGIYVDKVANYYLGKHEAFKQIRKMLSEY